MLSTFVIVKINPKKCLMQICILISATAQLKHIILKVLVVVAASCRGDTYL